MAKDFHYAILEENVKTKHIGKFIQANQVENKKTKDGAICVENISRKNKKDSKENCLIAQFN